MNLAFEYLQGLEVGSLLNLWWIINGKHILTESRCLFSSWISLHLSTFIPLLPSFSNIFSTLGGKINLDVLSYSFYLQNSQAWFPCPFLNQLAWTRRKWLLISQFWGICTPKRVTSSQIMLSNPLKPQEGKEGQFPKSSKSSWEGGTDMNESEHPSAQQPELVLRALKESTLNAKIQERNVLIGAVWVDSAYKNKGPLSAVL